MEVATVALCGGSVAGEFVWMLDAVDYATTWVELRAMWGRGQQGTLAALTDLAASLPFALLGLDSDNGGEFINHHVLHWLQKRPQPVFMTRSRPYKKDDNAHVEQKNWTHVRLAPSAKPRPNRATGCGAAPENSAAATCWNPRSGWSPGADGESLARVPAPPETPACWLAALPRESKDPPYRPAPVRRILIPKSNGGQRSLGIPPVTDRLVQLAARHPSAGSVRPLIGQWRKARGWRKTATSSPTGRGGRKAG